MHSVLMLPWLMKFIIPLDFGPGANNDFSGYIPNNLKIEDEILEPLISKSSYKNDNVSCLRMKDEFCLVLLNNSLFVPH